MRLHQNRRRNKIDAKAGEIAAEAHILAMQSVQTRNERIPGRSDDGSLYARQRRDAAWHIIRSSAAAKMRRILHYVENNCDLKDGDLLLIDAGANTKVTRPTSRAHFPSTANLPKPQREVYDIVLERADRNVSKRRKQVTPIKQRQDLSIELLTEGMKKLGLLKGKTKDLIKNKKYMKYYMHGVGHYLGLDVHDAGRYFTDQTAKNSRPFAPGMVLTVEPGSIHSARR